MIPSLQELGFSVNEAKVYLVLLKRNPINGYEIAKESGISRSMVYDILRRLTIKKAIVPLNSEPTTYAPVDYRELIQSHRDQQSSAFDKLESKLKEYLGNEESDDYVLNISTHDELVASMRQAVRSAKKEIAISMWANEVKMIETELFEAHKRGVLIHILSFDKMPFDFGVQHCYEIPDIETIFFNRRAILVTDRKYLLMGEWSQKRSEISISTHNQMLVNHALDQIILDVMLYYALRVKGGFQVGMKASEYQQCVYRYYQDIHLDQELAKFAPNID